MERLSKVSAILLLLSILLTACAAPNPYPGTPLKITVAVDSSYPPFEFVDTTKRQLSGYDVELMKAIAAKVNLEVEFKVTRIVRLFNEMESCTYDASISALTITEDRKKQVLFSTPYLSAGQVVVVKKANSRITGTDKLAGMTVGTLKDSVADAESKKLKEIKLKPYPSLVPAFEALNSGFLDAVISDKPMALNFIKESYPDLKVVGKEFAPEQYAVAVCKQKSDLLTRINKGLEMVKSDGTLDKLTKQWILNEGD